MKKNLLYHYTSLETLFAIIRNINNNEGNESDNVYFTLRGTHSCFLNDLTEGRLLPLALKKIGVDPMTIWLSEARQGYPFVVSLSELGNDLNMWRCYANNGNGISIGLDKDILYSAVKYNNCRLDKCEYVSLEKMIDILNQKKMKHLINSNNSNNILKLDRLISDLLIYKDKSFKTEKEWRIHDFNIESDFLYKDNLIIPYKEFRIPISALKSITLGPKCNYEKNIYSIRRILKNKIGSKLLNTIVFNNSKIPYI